MVHHTFRKFVRISIIAVSSRDKKTLVLSRFTSYRKSLEVEIRSSALRTQITHVNIDLENNLLDGDRRTTYILHRVKRIIRLNSWNFATNNSFRAGNEEGLYNMSASAVDMRTTAELQ